MERPTDNRVLTPSQRASRIRSTRDTAGCGYWLTDCSRRVYGSGSLTVHAVFMAVVH